MLFQSFTTRSRCFKTSRFFFLCRIFEQSVQCLHILVRTEEKENNRKKNTAHIYLVDRWASCHRRLLTIHTSYRLDGIQRYAKYTYHSHHHHQHWNTYVHRTIIFESKYQVWYAHEHHRYYDIISASNRKRKTKSYKHEINKAQIIKFYPLEKFAELRSKRAGINAPLVLSSITIKHPAF